MAPQAQIGAQGGILPVGAPESASSESTPANPTATASLVAVMAGLAGSITAQETGRVSVTISGDMANATATDGGAVQLAWGTGAAPANGAAATGTVVGGKATGTSATAGARVPFSLTQVITGLPLGTAVWLDLQFAAVTGGSLSLADVSIAATEF